MRFCPYPDSEVQLETAADIGGQKSCYEVTSNINPDVLLMDYLSDNSLNHRFDLNSKLANFYLNDTFSPKHYTEYSSADSTNDSIGINIDQTNKSANNEGSNDTDKDNDDPMLTYFISQFSKDRKNRTSIVNNLLKLEKERLKKIEDEKRRKLLEEKRLKEEAEKKAKEEAERKRLEEELRLKKLEQEKQLKLKIEKETQEKIKKENELKLEKQKQEEILLKQRKLDQIKEQESKTIYKKNEIESNYLKYVKNSEDIIINVLDPVKQNVELKKMIGSLKRKINPKFGQLTNSQEQLSKITFEICKLISQTESNDLAFKWILNFVSDAIISQAETEVSVNSHSGLPLAKLTLNLLIIFNDLSYYLLTKFYISCPYLIGYSCSQDTEEGRLRLGWTRDEETKKWESEIQHNERLSGITTLYSIITRLKLDSNYLNYNPSYTNHPLPINHSWIFLSRMVDIPTSLITETHYVIVGSWWDACASEFLQAYGKQSQKLLALISNEWCSFDGKSSAGKVRIKLLAEEWQQGKMQSIPDMEP